MCLSTVVSFSYIIVGRIEGDILMCVCECMLPHGQESDFMNCSNSITQLLRTNRAHQMIKRQQQVKPANDASSRKVGEEQKQWTFLNERIECGRRLLFRGE